MTMRPTSNTWLFPVKHDGVALSRIKRRRRMAGELRPRRAVSFDWADDGSCPACVRSEYGGSQINAVDVLDVGERALPTPATLGKAGRRVSEPSAIDLTRAREAPTEPMRGMRRAAGHTVEPLLMPIGPRRM